MSKNPLQFEVPLNVLLLDNGDKEALIAIAYYRGEGNKFAGPTRDAISQYVRSWREKLSPADRKRYDEILATVQVTAKMRRSIDQG